MTINGPAPMLLGFFMNAAIDQQCELYIKANGPEEEVNQKIENIYAGLGVPRPVYNASIPEGNDGLGLMLLGVTGDRVLPADVYNKIKAETSAAVRGTVQADILKEDQAQNTCIFSTEFALRLMGDAGILYPAARAEFLFRIHQRVPHCGGGGQSHHAVGVYRPTDLRTWSIT